MENEKQILVVGRNECFGLAYTLATSLGKSFNQLHESENVKDGLILQIQATGYDFGVNSNDLADYLISECDDFNFNNQTELNYIDFLNAYVSQHPQYKKDMVTPFSGLVFTEGINSAFQNLGESVKQFTLEAVKLKRDSLEARRNGNQKWYNNFKPKRKRK